MRKAFRLLAFAAGLSAAGAVAQTPPSPEPSLPVRVVNKSEPVLCAEKDNVQIDLVSPQVRQFRIQAVHPAYIGTIQKDNWAPDFTSCDMKNDPSFAAQPQRKTFWETPDFWLTGYTFPSFWRPNDVPVLVDGKEQGRFHLIQFWMGFRERAEEVLVVYPPDGYWRARPLPFADMRWTAYGSSFLVGPVEMQQRPIVALESIAFDTKTKSFTLRFKRGGSAVLTIAKIDQDHMALDVSLSGAMPDNLPFASLRSMYVTQFNNDAARVAWRGKDAASWGEAPIMQFKGADATEFWAGRTVPSRHNTSAPDMVFGNFRSAPAKPK